MLQKKITRNQRREGGGFGFGAARREQPRAMLLGAVVSDAGSIANAAEAGAEVVIVRARDAAKAISRASVKDVALGAWVESLDEAAATALHDAGCDFVVSSLDGTAAAAVETGRMGQVIIAGDKPDDNMLRSLGPLGLDALFVEHDGGSMSLRQQLELVRVASFASTPLIVTVSTDASVSELRVLRDSGTAVVLTSEGTGADGLRALGDRLREVPAPRRGRDNGREMAIVPSLASHHDEEDDEPDEE